MFKAALGHSHTMLSSLATGCIVPVTLSFTWVRNNTGESCAPSPTNQQAALASGLRWTLGDLSWRGEEVVPGSRRSTGREQDGAQSGLSTRGRRKLPGLAETRFPSSEGVLRINCVNRSGPGTVTKRCRFVLLPPPSPPFFFSPFSFIKFD